MMLAFAMPCLVPYRSLPDYIHVKGTPPLTFVKKKLNYGMDKSVRLSTFGGPG